MFTQFRGLILFAFGAFVVADTFLGMVLTSAGMIRAVYFMLGLYLVIRGILLMKSFFKKRTPPTKLEEIQD